MSGKEAVRPHIESNPEHSAEAEAGATEAKPIEEGETPGLHVSDTWFRMAVFGLAVGAFVARRWLGTPFRGWDLLLYSVAFIVASNLAVELVQWLVRGRR